MTYQKLEALIEKYGKYNNFWRSNRKRKSWKVGGKSGKKICLVKITKRFFSTERN